MNDFGVENVYLNLCIVFSYVYVKNIVMMTHLANNLSMEKIKLMTVLAKLKYLLF